MGRKILTCKIGDIFGCYLILQEPYILGEHSFVHVRCIKCNKEYDLCLSEIKNRKRLTCKNCRGELKRKYPDPKPNEIYKNWKVLKNKVKIKGFWCFECECIICHHIQYVRKDQLFTKSKKCNNCKFISLSEKTKFALKKQSIRRNQPFITVFNHVCSEASKRSILVTITPEYIEEIYNKQNKKCAITGDDLPDIRKASIDRIDSNKPYEVGNILIVTKQANLSKHIMLMEELYIFCAKVLNHANQQPSQPLKKLEGSETNA